MHTHRIGVVTLHGLTNYGNRLQAYAVHSILLSRGYQPWMFVFGPSFAVNHHPSVSGWIRTNLRRSRPAMQRLIRFRRFEKLMRHEAIHSRRHLLDTRDRFDCFVVGSDQVWNPHFTELAGPQFLDWAYGHQRICLAPSFGVDRLPANVARAYAEGLRGFERISVREYAGARIVRQLTGRDASVLIDPTLVLETSEWKALASDAARPATRYTLTYFLGEKSERRVSYVEAVSRTRGLAVVNLLDRRDPRTFAAGPAEFLDLVANAECVFTDSFHGSAFSLIFDVPVVIFAREGETDRMGSRIETFVRTFGLDRHLYAEGQGLDVFDPDYAHANVVLKRKRGEFLRYLDEELARSKSQASLIQEPIEQLSPTPEHNK